MVGKLLQDDEDNARLLEHILRMDGAREIFCPAFKIDKKKLMEFTGISRASMFRLTEGLTKFMTEARDLAIELEKAEGKSNKKIAASVGVTKETVKAVLGDEGERGEKISARQIRPSLFEKLSAPQDIRAYCRSDSPDVESPEDLPFDLDENSTYEEKKEALNKHIDSGWGTIARNPSRAGVT